MNSDIRLTLIRGLPGTGKRALAKRCLLHDKNAIHLEANQFFMQEGKFAYDPAKEKEAQMWCWWKTSRALQAGHTVVVSNTFVQLKDLTEYIQIADNLGLLWTVAEASNYITHPPKEHEVPEAVIQSMRERWEIIPQYAIYEGRNEKRRIERLLKGWEDPLREPPNEDADILLRIEEDDQRPYYCTTFKSNGLWAFEGFHTWEDLVADLENGGAKVSWRYIWD